MKYSEQQNRNKNHYDFLATNVLAWTTVKLRVLMDCIICEFISFILDNDIKTLLYNT